MYYDGFCSLIACCNRDCVVKHTGCQPRDQGQNITQTANLPYTQKGPGLLPGLDGSTSGMIYCKVSSSLCVLGDFKHVGLAATVDTP